MKETIYREQNIDPAFSTIPEFEFAPLEVRNEGTPVAQVGHDAQIGHETAALDSFLATIKWLFLYLPGAGALHFTLMGMSLFYFYGGAPIEVIVGAFGVSLIAMFMVMLGVGRLNDLRYLRVVAGIIATGALASILYTLSIVFIPGDFFGWFTLLSLPVTVIIGQLIKIKTDRESLPHE